MGMYNEVYKSCPKCDSRCTLHISQIVLGFGQFDLDSPSTTKDLSFEEKKELAESISDKSFYCDSCQEGFEVQLLINEDSKRVFI